MTKTTHGCRETCAVSRLLLHLTLTKPRNGHCGAYHHAHERDVRKIVQASKEGGEAMITVGSMFSGIGGIELGLERSLNTKTIWFCENEPYAQAVLKKHWKGVTFYDDITTTDWNKAEKPDIITGGFPCQDISNAGKRKGITGERSGLFYELWKAIRILRPRLVIMENVAALTHRGMGQVLGEISESGYDAEWDCIPASSVGAPHRRDRIFIIAYPNVPDAELKRLQGCSFKSMGRAKFPAKNSWWAVEPDVGRVAYGVPSWVDRIKCLGNAVVPQVAEYVGQRVLQITPSQNKSD